MKDSYSFSFISDCDEENPRPRVINVGEVQEITLVSPPTNSILVRVIPPRLFLISTKGGYQLDDLL